MVLSLLVTTALLLAQSEATQFRPPAHRARGNLALYISDADYPAEAIRRGDHGVVGFELDIDATGRVEACRVMQSSGSTVLDAATCRIMRERAQLTPARDRRGQPTRDRISQRIRWVLPPPPASRARAVLASYISDSDYPAEAIRRGEQGVVGFFLNIRADGVVSRCVVTNSSGSEALDSATCRIMQARARFTPARDRNGRAVADAVSARVRWVLPEDGDVASSALADFSAYMTSADYPAEAARLHEQGQVFIMLVISPEGRVAECRVAQSSGSARLDARSCEVMRARAQFSPARDASGNAIPTFVAGSVTWKLPPS